MIHKSSSIAVRPILHLVGPKDTVAEVGVCYGDSSRQLAANAGYVHLVDPFTMYPGYSDGAILADGTVEMVRRLHEQMTGYDNWSFHQLFSAKAAEIFSDGDLDLVFIDANHSFEAVTADILAWWPKVKEGGWLTGHDYELESVGRAVREFASFVKYPLGVFTLPADGNDWAFHKRKTVEAFCDD